MFNLQSLLIILTGTTGTLGFALLFKVNKKRILGVTLGGLLVCTVYIICSHFFESEFAINFFPALIAGVYSEVMARLSKSPALPFLICGIIPLVPGRGLYYTMNSIVIGNQQLFSLHAGETLRTAAGIAVGVILVSVLIFEINKKGSYLEFVRDDD